ncbi:MAG: 16S rRNA (cytosine(967)-C(5))-methyltransferase RsmB [Clostridia bacterium]|nr:16S rRNA (cytosine(967)-C(5))-methyltransferase RsmB [Clostridia bacterium]
MNARTVAYKLIEEWESQKTFPNLALKKALRSVSNERDRRFITALVYGVVERKITLDHFLAKCSERRLSSLSVPVLSILRMGLYQLFYMQIPASAACNTSVDLIKHRGFAHSAGYVNAVLRRCDRERETLLQLKKADFSVRYSIDPELVELLLDQYGKETFVSIMEGIGNPDTSMYLFHNIKRGSESEFISALKSEYILPVPTDLPHLYKINSGFSVEDSPAYQAGWFHIVGRHSAEAALLMPESAQKIMDLCAAPGGKTFVFAALTEGSVFSFDIHPHKIENLHSSAKRLGHSNVAAALADASEFLQDHAETADFVLCDVPCSGLGIMGKKPDIKYKKYHSKDFTELQYKILQNGARYLKPGGRLVYSTCTIDRRENELLIEGFLSQNPQFSFDFYGQKTFLPDSASDGFYIAALKKGNQIEN